MLSTLGACIDKAQAILACSRVSLGQGQEWLYMLCASKNPKNIYMYPATFTNRRSIIVIVEAIEAVVGVIVGRSRRST